VSHEVANCVVLLLLFRQLCCVLCVTCIKHFEREVLLVVFICTPCMLSFVCCMCAVLCSILKLTISRQEKSNVKELNRCQLVYLILVKYNINLLHLGAFLQATVGAFLQATSRVPRWWIGERPPDMAASCDIYK